MSRSDVPIHNYPSYGYYYRVLQITCFQTGDANTWDTNRGDDKRRKIEVDHHYGATRSSYPPAPPKPSKKRRHSDDSDGAELPPTKRSRTSGAIQSADSRHSDESSDAVDRIIPLGAALLPVQELSVKFSADCTSRQFDKRSPATNFLTEEEVCPLRIDFSLRPVEEEAFEEDEVVIPDAMGENEAATKIQKIFRRHYHGLPGLDVVDEDEEPVPRKVRHNVDDLPPAFLDEEAYPDDHLMYHPKHGVQSRAYLKEIGDVRPEPRSQTQVEFDAAMIDTVADENDGHDDLESVDFEVADGNTTDDDSVEVVGEVEEEMEEAEMEEEEEEEEVEVLQTAPQKPRQKRRMVIELQCSLDGRYWSQTATRRCIVRD